MKEDNKNVWDTLDIINAFSNEVIKDVDISKGATEEFIDLVQKLESEKDGVARSKIALDFINKNNGLKQINYIELGQYLKDPESCPLDTWRKLYVLERSIPPRKNNTNTWFDRLKIFYDTYLLEHHLLHTKVLDDKKGLLFTKVSGDHENLHMGPGTYAPDFYCWDEKTNKPTFVELKHKNTTDIQDAINYYENKIYGAKYLVVHLADGKFYLVDYTVKPASYKVLNIPAINGLLIW